MGKFLHWLQERIKHWIKPATSVLIIGILSDLTRSHADLVVENALLRQQLIVLNRQVKLLPTVLRFTVTRVDKASVYSTKTVLPTKPKTAHLNKKPRFRNY